MSLKHGISLSSDVKNSANDLKEMYSLTDFESLTLSLKAEQNELFRLAFVISSSDSHQTSLEAIEISLGYTN